VDLDEDLAEARPRRRDLLHLEDFRAAELAQNDRFQGLSRSAE
jgi:hypothetical protein